MMPWILARPGYRSVHARRGPQRRFRGSCQRRLRNPPAGLFAPTDSPGRERGDDYGFAMSEKLYPTYSAAWFSARPSWSSWSRRLSLSARRKIAKLKPTDALRGKLT